MDFTKMLPEECMCLILSLISPRDACRSALVCPALRSIVDFDAVWERFLHCDYKEIISRSSSPSLSSLLSLAKKDLYVHLSFHPILIENGSMLSIGKRDQGKMLYARAKSTFSYMGRYTLILEMEISPESRFSEVAELKNMFCLEVKGKIETKILSSRTNYIGYIVFKISRNTNGFRKRTVGLRVNVVGTTLREILHRELCPTNKMGGWMKIEMGEFLNEGGDDGIVEFSFREVNTFYDERGLIIEGIELRPKDIGR